MVKLFLVYSDLPVYCGIFKTEALAFQWCGKNKHFHDRVHGESGVPVTISSKCRT